MSNTDKPHIELASGNTKKLTDTLLAHVRRGAELTRLLKDQKKELDEINAVLKDKVGPGVSIVLPNEIRVPIAEMLSVSIGDAEGLKEHLGTRRFNQVVNTQVTYKTTDTLLNTAQTDADVDKCLARRASISVKYLPIKTQK